MGASYFVFHCLWLLAYSSLLVKGTTEAGDSSSAPAKPSRPITVTAHFPCLTSNSILELTVDATTSIFPVWKCTKSCGPSSEDIGLMVFPPATTTGTFEILPPPSDYPTLAVESHRLITITSQVGGPYFATNVATDTGPHPTSIQMYPNIPDFTLTVTATTGIPALLATPISIAASCGTETSGSGQSGGTTKSNTDTKSTGTRAISSSGAGFGRSTSTHSHSRSISEPPSSSKHSNTATGESQNSYKTNSGGRTASHSTPGSSSDLSTPRTSTAARAQGTNTQALGGEPSVTRSTGSSTQRASQDTTSATASATIGLPPGASVITSVIGHSTVIETFLPTTYTSLVSLKSALTTSTTIYDGTSSTVVPLTIWPGGVGWQYPSLTSGEPLLPPPSSSPVVGPTEQTHASAASAPPRSTGTGTELQPNTRATTISSSAQPGSGPSTTGPGHTNPPQITQTPDPQWATEPPLPTFTSTTTPLFIATISDVHSDGHTDHHGSPVPVFWHPHCILFCPPGGCGTCGFSIDLKPGIYPPGSIHFPPGWTGPFPEITVHEDGTPEYSEDEDENCETTKTATDITYYVSYELNSEGQTTKTDTTSTGSHVTEGCSVTGTTTTVETAACQTSTVTDFYYYVSYGTNADGKTTTTATVSTSTEVTKGCSVSPFKSVIAQTASCQPSTVTDFFYYISYGTDNNGRTTTTATISTSSETTKGCSISPFSTDIVQTGTAASTGTENDSTVKATAYHFESAAPADSQDLSKLATALDDQWSKTEWLGMGTMTGFRTSSAGSTRIVSSSSNQKTSSRSQTAASGDTIFATAYHFDSAAPANSADLSKLATAIDDQWSSEWKALGPMTGSRTGTGTGTGTQNARPSTSVTPSKTTQGLFPSLAGGAPPAPNESLICQDPGQAKFKLSDADSHLEEYCSKFDGTTYPAITSNPSALREFYDNGAGVYVELWSNINTQDNSCKAGEVKFSKAECITALQDAFSKCHDPNSQDTTGGNAEPFNCANFGFIGNTNAPPATTNFATTVMPQMPAFTCTSSMKNPVDPDYPCLCEGFTYCSQSGGGCGWTTEPAAENCCEDCM